MMSREKKKTLHPISGKLTKPCQVFAALNFFLILSIFILVFGNLVGIKLPRYYPLLRQWSIIPQEGPSMGFYGAVGFSLLVALPLAVIFYWLSPFLQRSLEIRFKTFKNLSTGFILLGLLYFVVKEGQKWGIEKMGLQGQTFLGPELWLFALVLLLFLLLLYFLLLLEKKIFE